MLFTYLFSYNFPTVWRVFSSHEVLLCSVKVNDVDFIAFMNRMPRSVDTEVKRMARGGAIVCVCTNLL